MKTCTKCKTARDENEFAFRNKALGKRHQICKFCTDTGSKKHYERYKQYYKDKARRRDVAVRIELRNMLLGYLSNQSCADCSEDDPVVLEFDHVRHIKTKTISALITAKASWNVILKEIAKCDVVCANCHRRRTYLRCSSYRIRDIG
ncbi:MAG: hypothetical protein MSG64_20755 [Pyrinomonadaceae bacterium MAG19_C2-C3]|nr:hypothetical protein [Pyrinomonadaceae bacterium MAG19_C2-C3]